MAKKKVTVVVKKGQKPEDEMKGKGKKGLPEGFVPFAKGGGKKKGKK